MVLDAFVFEISLPADSDLLPLLRAVSGSMARYLGLPDEDARQAGDVLVRLVAERVAALDGTGPVLVRFERPHTADTVTVEVTSAALPHDRPASDASAIGPARQNGHSRIRLSWRVHNGGA